jgi:nucleotide-binding universal stress UspA family protein
MKILLATDGSEYSEAAARFLTKFKFTPDDEIHIIHVISWVPIMHEWESLVADFETIREKVVPKILDSASGIVTPTGAKINTSFTEGHADKAIVDAVEETGADLVVMGAKGDKGLVTHLIGSVTKLVALNSPKPVLIVKHPHEETPGKFKVLFPTDGSDHSVSIGKFLSSMPFPDNTELSLLSVIFSALSDIPERFSVEIDDRIKNIVAGTRESEFSESDAVLKAAYDSLYKKFSSIEKITKFGDPPAEIINAAEKLNADLIVVGTRGMRGIKGVLGSVSRYILNHSKYSVLIGKT